VTTTFLKNSKKKVGDYIAIRSGEEYIDYKIVDACSSFENMGKVLLISKDNFIKDIVHNNFILYLIKAKEGYDPESVVENIEANVKEEEYESIITLKEMFKENQKENNKLFLLINTLFFISAFVSIICLNNNLIVNILTRARAYAIERTIGMSQTQLRKVITFEGIILCAEGGILGLILGCFMNIYLVKILSYYIGDLAITINYAIMAALIGVSLLIGLVSGIYPYKKMCKMNIVQSIKGFE
jgi:putative ABC transport system permease protein